MHDFRIDWLIAQELLSRHKMLAADFLEANYDQVGTLYHIYLEQSHVYKRRESKNSSENTDIYMDRDSLGARYLFIHLLHKQSLLSYPFLYLTNLFTPKMMMDFLNRIYLTIRKRHKENKNYLPLNSPMKFLLKFNTTFLPT